MATQTILGGKAHLYKRPNSRFWQCSTYLAGRGRRPVQRVVRSTLTTHEWSGRDSGFPYTNCSNKSTPAGRTNDGACGTFLFDMAQHLVTLEVQLRYTAQSFDHERPQVTIRAVLTTEASAGSILEKRTGGGARTSHPYHVDAPVFWTDAPKCSPLDGGPPGE